MADGIAASSDLSELRPLPAMLDRISVPKPPIAAAPSAVATSTGGLTFALSQLPLSAFSGCPLG